MRRFLTGDRVVLADVRAAISLAEGLPRRAIVVGGPDMLPREYAPGAAGWTDQVCPELVVDGTTAALQVPPEADKHLGKTVRVRSADVKIPEERACVDEPDLPPALREGVRIESVPGKEPR